MLTELALAPLRAITAAGLKDRAVLETATRVRGAGGVYLTTWIAEAAQPALLMPASAGGTNIRADQPSAAGEWILALRSGSTISEGQRALVTGTTHDVAWQRLVLVAKVLHPTPHELERRALCTDVETSP